MKKTVKQFGGDLRVFMSEDFLNNIPESTKERMNDDELEAIEIIKEGFAQLTQVQRTIMGMIAHEEITLEKIAKRLGMQIGTVTTHYKRAKNKLRKYVLNHADGSIYIESMLRETEDDKEETSEHSADADGESGGPSR